VRPACTSLYCLSLHDALPIYVLGFVNLDNSGVGGVEQRYNDLLKGRPGEIRFKKDARGIRFSDGPEEFRPPRHGKDLILTLDREDRKSTRLNSSHVKSSYAVF